MGDTNYEKGSVLNHTSHVTAMVEFIKNSDEEGLLKFLASHPNLNLAAIDDQQRTVFHWAAEYPTNAALFEALLQHHLTLPKKAHCPLDFLVLQKDVHSDTPLMIAITHGRGDLIKYIDAAQREPRDLCNEEFRIRIPDFMPSLDMALNNGHLKESIAALKACARLDLDVIPTIVLWAIQGAHLEVIDTCWELLADLEAQINMVMAAIAAGQHRVIVFLRDRCPDCFRTFLRAYTPARAGSIETFDYLQQMAVEQGVTITFTPKDLIKAATSGCLVVFQAVENALNKNETDRTEFYQESLTAAAGTPGPDASNIITYLLGKGLALDKADAIKEAIRSKNLTHYRLLHEDDTQQPNANMLQDALPAFLEQDPQFAQTLLEQGIVANVRYPVEYTVTNKLLHELQYHQWRCNQAVGPWGIGRIKICLLGLAIIKNCPLTTIEMIIAQQPPLRLHTALLCAIFRGDQAIIDSVLAIQNEQEPSDQANDERFSLTDLLITTIKTLANPDKTILSLLHMITDADIHDCSALSYALLYGLSDTVVNALYKKGMRLRSFVNEVMHLAIARDETLALALFSDCQQCGTALDNESLARSCLGQNKTDFLLQLIDASSDAEHETAPNADDPTYNNSSRNGTSLLFRWGQEKPKTKPISLQLSSIYCAIELACEDHLSNRRVWDGLTLTDDIFKMMAYKLAHTPPSQITTICLAKGLSLITLTNAALEAKNFELLRYCLQNGIKQSPLCSKTFYFHIRRAYRSPKQTMHLLHTLAKHPDQTFANLAIQMVCNEFHWSLDCGADTEFFSPLHIAAWEGKHEIVACLLALGEDANKQNKIGLTPLHAAAFKNRERVVNVLLSAGADARQLTSEGRSPLYCAFLNEEMASTIIERLIEAGGLIEGENYLQAHMVARFADGAVIKKISKNPNLLSARALDLCTTVNKIFDATDSTKALHGLPCTFFNSEDNSKQPKYPIHAAIYRNDITLLKQLIEADVDLEQPDEHDKRPLDIAIADTQALWIVPILLENGVDLGEEYIEKLELLTYYRHDYHKKWNPNKVDEARGRSQYLKALILEKDNPQEALTQYEKLAKGRRSIQPLALKRHAHLLSTMENYSAALQIYQQAIELGYLHKIADDAIDLIWRLSNGTITNHNLVVIEETADNRTIEPVEPSQDQNIICDVLEQLLDAKYEFCTSHFKLADSLLHFDLSKYLLHRYTRYHLDQVRPNRRFYAQAQWRINMLEESYCPITAAIDQLLHEQDDDDLRNKQILVLLTQVPDHLDGQTLKRHVLRFLLTEICKHGISAAYISAIGTTIISCNTDMHAIDAGCQFALQYPLITHNKVIEKTLHTHLLGNALSYLFFRVDQLLCNKQFEDANTLLQEAQNCELFQSKFANPNTFFRKDKNALIKIRRKIQSVQHLIQKIKTGSTMGTVNPSP